MATEKPPEPSRNYSCAAHLIGPGIAIGVCQPLQLWTTGPTTDIAYRRIVRKVELSVRN